MKYLFLISLGLLIISCTPSSESNSSEKVHSNVDVTDEIQDANDRFMAAYNAHDATKVANEIFSKNAMVYPPGSPVVTGGSEVLEGFWKAVMDSGVHKAEIKTDKAIAYGNIAIDVGKVKLYDAENKLLDDAKYLVVWTKENNQWKITKDIWNSSKN